MGILILILFIEYFPSNKASDNIETFEEQNDNKETLKAKVQAKEYKEDDKIEDTNEEYNDNHEDNYFVCNTNIINNFKINRLIKKAYLNLLVTSYNEDKYDAKKRIWNPENETSASISMDKNPKIVKFLLNPKINGYDINNTSILLVPSEKSDIIIGMEWEEINKINKDYIEIDEDTKGYDILSKSLLKKTSFKKSEMKDFPNILRNNYIIVNGTIYKPYIKNYNIIKELSLLFALKFNGLNNDSGLLLYVIDENNKEVLTIKIIDSNKVKTNNIGEYCKNNKYCNNLITNVQTSINMHNNYYDNYNINKNEMKEYLANKCDSGGEKMINSNMCNYIKKTYGDEVNYYEQLYEKKRYTIQININGETFNIYDLDENIFNTDYTLLSFIINNNNISFNINENKYSFVLSNDKELHVSYPIIINKQKECDVTLYSMALFTKAICDADIQAYKLYNNYHLYGNE